MKDYVKLLDKNHPTISVSCTGDSGVYANIIWHDTPNEVTEATLDGYSLDFEKAQRHEEIDNKTAELLDEGSFIFEGKEFKLTDRAILRWVGVSNADMKNLIGFPYTVTTKDYDSFSITSKAHWTSFFGTGLGTAEFIEGGGRTIHAAINAATTQAELDAVVDNR